MIRLSILSILLLLVSSVSSSFAQSQSEMNAQAARDAAKADAELNKVYKKVMAAMEDEQARKLLREAQRAWITYRDTQAAFAADEARGGSMAPLLYSGMIATLTEERTRLLQQRLGDGSSPPPEEKPKPAPKTPAPRAEPVTEDGPVADGAKTQAQAAQVFFDSYKAHNRKAALSVATEKAIDKLVWAKDAGDNDSLRLMDTTHIYYEGGHIELRMEKNKAGRWFINDVKLYAD